MNVFIVSGFQLHEMFDVGDMAYRQSSLISCQEFDDVKHWQKQKIFQTFSLKK